MAIVFRLLGITSIPVEPGQAPLWLTISYVIGVSFVAQGIGEEALGLGTSGPLDWLTNGAVFFIAGLIISALISKERWNEMAERGPYALPIAK